MTRIDIWSDYICPWCYLATETAAWLANERGCQVVWHPFELHPEIPLGGITIERRPPRDGGGRFDKLMAAAGLPYERPPRAVNSHAALEVGELARREGVFDEWHRRSFAAFFVDELDLSDEAVLRGVGEESGLDPDDVSDALSSAVFRGRVDASKDKALDLGIGGTPGFLFDKRLVVPGVQERAVYERILSRIRAT